MDLTQAVSGAGYWSRSTGEHWRSMSRRWFAVDSLAVLFVWTRPDTEWCEASAFLACGDEDLMTCRCAWLRWIQVRVCTVIGGITDRSVTGSWLDNLWFMLMNIALYGQGKARQVYLYSTFHTQWQFKVLYIKESDIIIHSNKNKELKIIKQGILKWYRNWFKMKFKTVK